MPDKPPSSLRPPGAVDPVDRDLAVLDERLVEPARTGLRRAAGGLGTVASAALVVAGAGSGVFGGILMALTTLGLVDAIGAIFLAIGLTAIAVGGVGLWAVRRVGTTAEQRALERRIVKIAAIEGAVHDAAIARRLRLPVEVVRATADRLVRAGTLDVDVDDESGDDVYRVAGPLALEAAGVELSPEEREAMRDFEGRLAAAEQEAGVIAEEDRVTR